MIGTTVTCGKKEVIHIQDRRLYDLICIASEWAIESKQVIEITIFKPNEGNGFKSDAFIYTDNLFELLALLNK